MQSTREHVPSLHRGPGLLLPTLLFGLAWPFAQCISACSSAKSDGASAIHPAGAADGGVSDSAAAMETGTGRDAASHLSDGGPGTTSGLDSGADVGPVGTGCQSEGGVESCAIPAGGCFTFSTATFESSNMTCGDLLTLSGANIDLQSGAGAAALCDLGTFASLSAVPTSYANCTWTNYIEGGGGLVGEGIIVLDSSGTHHYRMRIATNIGPDLVFSYADID